MAMAHTCPHKRNVEVLPPGISKHVLFDNTAIIDLFNQFRWGDEVVHIL